MLVSMHILIAPSLHALQPFEGESLTVVRLSHHWSEERPFTGMVICRESTNVGAANPVSWDRLERSAFQKFPPKLTALNSAAPVRLRVPMPKVKTWPAGNCFTRSMRAAVLTTADSAESTGGNA
jgi:hypothetical protein